MSARVPEGWYADPQDPTPGAERWWNGVSWTAHTRERPAPEPAPAPAWAEAPPPSAPPPQPASTTTVPAAPAFLPDGTPLADLGPRIGAYLVDVVLVYAVVSVALGVVDAFTALSDLVGVPGALWSLVGTPTRALLLAAVWLGYQLVCLTRGGRTLGKRWLGMRVRRVDRDEALTPREALTRALAGGGGILLVLFPGSQLFGFVLVGVDAYRMQQDPLRRPWHDQLVGTAVVRVPGR